MGNLQAPKIQTVFWKRNFPAPQSVGAGLLIVLSLTLVVSPSGLAARSVQRWGSQGAHGAKGPLESQDVLLRGFVLRPKNHGFSWKMMEISKMSFL